MKEDSKKQKEQALCKKLSVEFIDTMNQHLDEERKKGFSPNQMLKISATAMAMIIISICDSLGDTLPPIESTKINHLLMMRALNLISGHVSSIEEKSLLGIKYGE